VVRLTVSDGDLSATDDCRVTVNAPPEADAGPDQQVSVGETVQMDGSGSSDPDGDALTYSWQFVSRPEGSSATLSSPTSSATSFTPDVGGEYTVRLTVSDGGLTSTDECTADANSIPVADAGPDQSVNLGAVVHLDGSGSSDPDGDALTYSWQFESQPEGSSATISTPTPTTAAFDPDVGGEYVVRLVVNDGKASSGPDDCLISVNTPPEANAGPDQEVNAGETVHVDGSGSHDADGDPLTYSWSMFNRPSGSNAALSRNDIPNPTFTADVLGIYQLSLTASDGKASDEDWVTIRAKVDPRAGRYTGTTSQGRPISFTVSPSQDAIEPGLEIKFDVVCATSSWIRTIGVGNNPPITNGSFSITVPTCHPPPCAQPLFYVWGRVRSETTFSGSATVWNYGDTWEGCPSEVEVTWQASWAGPAPAEGGAARIDSGALPVVTCTPVGRGKSGETIRIRPPGR
jgi:hypothetical protein